MRLKPQLPPIGGHISNASEKKRNGQLAIHRQDEGPDQMSDMDGIERNAVGMSRRFLLGAGLVGATVIVGGMARAADPSSGVAAFNHGANDPLPPEAASAN